MGLFMHRPVLWRDDFAGLIFGTLLAWVTPAERSLWGPLRFVVGLA